MRVQVYALPSNAAGLRHVVTALQQLGYRAQLVVYNNPKLDYFSFVADSRHKVQAAFFGWVAGDVNAGGFFDGTFQCGGYTPASASNLNPSGYCSRATDRLIAQAKQAQASAPASANAVWARVDRSIVDASPWIPVVTPTWVDLVSKRIHNFTRNPVLGVIFDQMWVR
jgi:ABC-type transport system substrate-binding protein